ncbi:MAG TPA: hypothetical protein VF156_15540 [Agromyces sp.]
MHTTSTPDPAVAPDDGTHPRVITKLAEATGDAMGAIGEHKRGENREALASCERALASAEEAVRLLRSMRQVLTAHATPTGLRG